MSRLFQSYIVVDWSAASKPTTGADSIWIGAYTPDARFRMQFDAVNPPTRAKAQEILADVLERLTRRRDRVLVGFDFSLGYPAGTAQALGLDLNGRKPWMAMHQFLQKEMKDKPDNANNRFPLAARMNRLISGGPFPFWGVPKRDEVTTLSQTKPRDHGPDDIAEYRHTELTAQARHGARPQSCWKLAYAGAVGSQSLTGIPVVSRLREKFPASRLWPFETGWRALNDEVLDDVQIVFAEVYPSLVKAKPQPGETKDRAQVRALCESLLERDSTGRLSGKFGQRSEDAKIDPHLVTDEEGWILGV